MRGNPARAFLAPVAVLALVAVVAVASTGATPRSTGGTRGPSELVLDTLVTLTLLLFVLAIAFVVYALFHRKELAAALPARRKRRSGLGSIMIFFGILALLAYLHSRDLLPNSGPEDRTPPEGSPPGGEGGADPGRYEPQLAWIPLLVVVALGAVATAALIVAARRRRPQRRASVAATLASALDDSLDDLHAEADPRRAVIASYARLERILAGHGLGRNAPETPEEYLARILPDLDVDPSSIRRLTELYTWAKFSHHEVGVSMKDEAIAALTSVRDELREAETVNTGGAEPSSAPVERPA